MGHKTIVGTILCGVVATLLMPASVSAQPVQDRVSGTEKGSLLIFPKVEVRWDDSGFVTQDTFISLTNDYPGAVDVQMYFVMGDPYLGPEDPGWNCAGLEYWSDVKITLTPNQPTYWSALTGLGYPGPAVSPWTVLDPIGPGRPNLEEPGRYLRGYIIAFACDSETGQEIQWDHLAGNGTIVNYQYGYAWEYNTFAFQTQGSGVTPDGALYLDGNEYARCFEYLLLNFQAVGSVAYSNPGGVLVFSDTDLTLLTLGIDLRQNWEELVGTKANFLIWNQWEAQFSGAHRCVWVWDQALFSRYDSPNHFLKQFLQTDQGKARFKGVASDDNCQFDPDCPTRDAPLLGVAAKMLYFDGVLSAAAGSNLFGMGFDDTAVIRYEPSGPPPPQGMMDRLLPSAP
jgi:hypothetical protein